MGLWDLVRENPDVRREDGGPVTCLAVATAETGLEYEDFDTRCLCEANVEFLRINGLPAYPAFELAFPPAFIIGEDFGGSAYVREDADPNHPFVRLWLKVLESGWLPLDERLYERRVVENRGGALASLFLKAKEGEEFPFVLAMISRAVAGYSGKKRMQAVQACIEKYYGKHVSKKDLDDLFMASTAYALSWKPLTGKKTMLFPSYVGPEKLILDTLPKEEYYNPKWRKFARQIETNPENVDTLDLNGVPFSCRVFSCKEILGGKSFQI